MGVKINELNEYTRVFDTDYFIDDRAGGTGRVTLATIANYLTRNANLLDNWCFAAPINQRGLTEYTTQGYTIDRWKAVSNNMKVTVNNDHTLVEFSGTSGNGVFSQPVKAADVGIKPGDQVTISFFAEVVSSGEGNVRLQLDNDARGIYLGTAIPAKIGQKVLYTTTKTVPSTHNINDLIRITIYSTKAFSIKLFAAKLEHGNQQTLARQDASGNWVLNDPPPNKELELLKCQRYYQKINYTPKVLCYYANTIGGFPFICNMRAVPTVNFTVADYTGTAHNVTAKSVKTDGVDYARIENGVKGEGYNISGITCNAEL